MTPLSFHRTMIRPLSQTPLRLHIATDLWSLIRLRLLHVLPAKTLELSSRSDETVLYLTNSCGLSATEAFSAAKKLRLKSTNNADSILSLLRTHGLTGNQIAKVITKFPTLLSLNAERIIKPKLEFFVCAGFSSTVIPKIVASNPFILRSSLERKLRPNFDILKTILGDSKEVATAVYGANRLLQIEIKRDMLPNMKTLEEHGVPRHRIVKMATFYARAFLQSSARFSKVAVFLKERGLDPSKTVFVRGIVAICGLNHSTRERKLQVYRSLGWSEEDIDLLFKTFPFCLLISDERIKLFMSFYVEKLKWKHSFLAARPKLMTLSLEKTIIPRYNVFKILESKGLVKRTSLASFLRVTEKHFLDKYVIKYGRQVPEVLDAYKIKLELARLNEVN